VSGSFNLGETYQYLSKSQEVFIPITVFRINVIIAIIVISFSAFFYKYFE